MVKIRFRNNFSEAHKHLFSALAFLLIIIFLGTAGYTFFEGWGFLDSLYMTIITITTTGFREVHPLSTGGEIFTIVILIFGFSALAYAAGRGAQYIFEYGLFWRRKMKKKITSLKNHTIVCGFGRMGREICRMLEINKSPFIVIEQDKEAIGELMNLDYTFFEGNANEDETLKEARINEAKSVIAVLSTDADNVYTVLTARDMNPKLKILARAVTESSERKLLKAGANKVILPYILGGRRIALSLLKPEVMDFFHLVGEDSNLNVQLDAITLTEKSEFVNLELSSTFIRSDLDIIIVMIIRKDQTIVYNPRGNTMLIAGDRLIAIGEPESLNTLLDLANGR